MFRLVVLPLVAACPAVAADWEAPSRDTALAMMAALTPKAEAVFGAPVEFWIEPDSMRVADDQGFARVWAARPGGGEIDIETTPGWAAGYFQPDADWTLGHALLAREGEVWVVVEHAFGVTEAWWAAAVYCARWRAVIPEFCP